MLFRQMLETGQGCASYLLGCSAAGEAAVVDPVEGIGVKAYLLEAAEAGLGIAYVIDTHLHADHRTIGPELAAAAGARYCLHDSARGWVKLPFRPLSDGESIRLGRVELKVIYTPGHTPDSICLLVTDHARSEEPWFLLSGDTLFVGDVGRPDLLVGDDHLDVWGMRQRAELLFHSLKERLMALPDHVEIFPGHYGGSSCGGVHMSGKVSSTIAFERRFNLALQFGTPEAFAGHVMAGLKPQPRDFQRIKLANLGLKEVR